MPRSLPVLLLCLGVALSGCNCGLTVFDTTVKAQTMIPGSTGLVKLLGDLGPLQGFSNIDFNNNQDFKNQGVKKSDVDSVKVTKFTLKIVSPSDQDYSFLKSLQFFAEADGKKVLLAEKLDIDKLGLKAPNPTVTFDVKDVELKPFVTAPSMSITTAGSGTQPNRDTTLEAAITLRIDVKVL